MAKDKTQGMQRIDLRIPDHIYTQIETIAIYNKLPFSPTTKPNIDGTLKTDKDGNEIQPKVSVSPIIIDLINLGLKAIANGEENSDKLGDKTRNIDYQVNNQVDISEIEKKIINTLTQKIEVIVSDKLEGIISDKLEGIISDKIISTVKNVTEIQDTLEIMIEDKVRELLDIFSDKELEEINPINPELIPDIENNFSSEIKEILSLEDTSTQELINQIKDTNTQELVNQVKDTNDIEINNHESVKVNIPDYNEQIVSQESDNNEVEISDINYNEDNAQIEINLINTTINNTLLESPIVPLKEELGDKIPDKDNLLDLKDNEIKSFKEAEIEIKRLKSIGLGNTGIAKELNGKYFTKQGKTNWSDTQVKRILKSAV